MLLPLQGANPNIHRPRALPWAGCLLAFQAVTSQKLYRTSIKIYTKKTAYSLEVLPQLYAVFISNYERELPSRTSVRQPFLISHLIPICGLESAHARQRSSKLDAALAYSQISHLILLRSLDLLLARHCTNKFALCPCFVRRFSFQKG